MVDVAQQSHGDRNRLADRRHGCAPCSGWEGLPPVSSLISPDHTALDVLALGQGVSHRRLTWCPSGIVDGRDESEVKSDGSNPLSTVDRLNSLRDEEHGG